MFLIPLPTIELRQVEFSAAVRAEVDRLLARYPVKKAAILPVFHLAEREFGIIDESVMVMIGGLLDLPPSKVLGVYTFYTWFKRAGTGRHLLQVCCTLPCALRGSDIVVNHIVKRLGIKVGESTKDGVFTLRKVECLAACDKAPCIQINEDMYENLTLTQVDKILDQLQQKKK